MIERITIRNYRLFRDFEAHELGRLNIISGKNNSGKSTLLECLFLLASAGNRKVLTADQLVRRIPFDKARKGITMDVLWKSIFHHLDTTQRFGIEVSDTIHGNLSLNGAVTFANQVSLPVEQGEEIIHRHFSRSQGITLTYRHNDMEFSNSILEGKGNWNPEVSTGNYDPPYKTQIVSPGGLIDGADTVAPSALRQTKRSEIVLEALRLIDPRISSIEENFAGGEPTIWVDVGLGDLVALSVLGNGMVYATRIVTALLHCQNGILLVDELENGLHYSSIPGLWRVIDEVSQCLEVQVFAPTHSSECVFAAMESPNFGDFRYHRLDRNEESVKCVTYGPDQIKTSAELNFEIR